MNFIVALLLAAVALLGIAIWSIKRHQDPRLELDTDAPLEELRLVLDATGCKKMRKAAQQRMRDAGCRIAIYHPRTLRNIGVIAERDHRKLTVLDGRIAWVGGHCIVDEWLGDAEDRYHVRDLSVRLTGPIPKVRRRQ